MVEFVALEDSLVLVLDSSVSAILLPDLSLSLLDCLLLPLIKPRNQPGLEPSPLPPAPTFSLPLVPWVLGVEVLGFTGDSETAFSTVSPSWSIISPILSQMFWAIVWMSLPFSFVCGASSELPPLTGECISKRIESALPGRNAAVSWRWRGSVDE